MTPDITRGDAGRQPQPHYCTAKPRPDGYREGCPDWPLCVFSESRERIVTSVDDVTAERLARLALTATERGSGSTLGRDLAALAGWAAGAVLVLVVAAILLPLFV